jgi:RimJ/RimL family protein N-acetyltransferase
MAPAILMHMTAFTIVRIAVHVQQNTQLIIKKDSCEFLGYISIHQVNSKTPELGIWLKKDAHGFHYGYEALNLLKNWAEHRLHYEYLKYPVVKINIASRKLAEKLGGCIEDEYIKMSESGNELDEVEYRFYKNR